MFLCVSAVRYEDALFYRAKFLLLVVVYDIFTKCLQYIYERGRRLAELPGGRMVMLKEGNSMPELALKIGIVVYFLLIVPVAFVMPEHLAWENGPLEILQNIVLFCDVVLCLVLFRKTAGQKFHLIWLSGAGYFLLLLGREMRWGRIFFQTGMDQHGPTFIAMNAIPGHQYIHGGISIYTAAVLVSLIWLVPWKKLFHELPFPKLGFVILVLSAILAACGDKGLLFHSYLDGNIEELAELLAYMLQGGFAAWYYKQFKTLK